MNFQVKKVGQVISTKNGTSQTYKSDLEKFPKEILCSIIGSLTVYESGRLSFTSKFLRMMFFSAGLKPGYLVSLKERQQQDEGELPVFVVKAVRYFEGWWVDPTMSDQEIFEKYEICRKPDYLVCDEKGLKLLGLDSPLMKIKVRQLGAEQILLKKKEVMADINAKLVGLEPEKEFWESRIIQECLFIGFFTIPELELHSWRSSIGRCLEYTCIQEAIGHNQLAKDKVLNFNWNTVAALGSLKVSEARNKKQVTLTEIIQYPVQVRFLFEDSFILDAVFKAGFAGPPEEKITKQEVFRLEQHQMDVLRARLIQVLIINKGHTIAEVLKWDKNLVEKILKVFRLGWVDSLLHRVTRNPHSTSTSHSYFVPGIKQVLIQPDVLLDIEAKHGDYHGGNKSGVKGYLQEVWKGKLDVEDIIFAAPEVIRSVLLSDIDEQLALAVSKNLIDVKELIKLKPDEIEAFAKESTQLIHEKRDSSDNCVIQ